MNVKEYLREAARSEKKRALPILSFPAVQKMDATVEELCKNSELQAKAMEIVARDTDTLAAVSLMDLSVEAEAFGASVRFSAHEVPAVVGQLVSDENEAEALEVPDLTKGRAAVCAKGISLAKERITDKPVLAGMIGPFSLAGRLMDVTEIMYICYDEPETVHVVLKKATEYLLKYGQSLKEAGADGLVLAEPLAGILSPDMAAEFSTPYVKELVDGLQTEDFAVLYHNCGNSVPAMLEDIVGVGAAAYHFGNAVSMKEILEKAPADCLCLGNIDPAGEFAMGTPESMTAAVKALMADCGSYVNFLPSSGCDIPAHAKWENIRAFFAALE